MISLMCRWCGCGESGDVDVNESGNVESGVGGEGGSVLVMRVLVWGDKDSDENDGVGVGVGGNIGEDEGVGVGGKGASVDSDGVGGDVGDDDSIGGCGKGAAVDG